MNSPMLNPDACIACTSCVVQCPVAQATSNFLGPRMVGPAHERFRLLGLAEEASLHYCANCKNCDIACPHGVPISTFNMLGRAAQAKKQRPPLRDWMLAHGELMARTLGFLPAALRNAGMLNPLTRSVLKGFGISDKAPLPPFAPRTLRQILKKRPKAHSADKVVFFPGCYLDIYEPQAGLDIIWLLEKAGYEVLVPDDFHCCGLPMMANGFWEDARASASGNLTLLRQFKAQGLPVLTACPSCALMFSHDLPLYFPELVGGDSATTAPAPHGETALEDTHIFVQQAIDAGRLSLDGAALQGEILYHAPCHMRAQGVGLPALELLRRLPNTTVRNADAGCCGISGSYGFKDEKYAIAMQVGAALFDTVAHSPAAIVASECGTCRVQIRHGGKLDAQGRQSLHPLSVLRRALDN